MSGRTPERREPAEGLDAQVRYFASHSNFPVCYDALPDNVLILDDQLRVVFANNTALKWLGLSRGRFRGSAGLGVLLGCVDQADDLCRECGAVGLCAIPALIGGRNTTRECHVARKSGEPLDLYLWATPLREDAREYTVVVIRDITVEKHRHELDRVFYHDVLNVVSNILISADLLQNPSSPAEADYLRANVMELAGQAVSQIKAQRDLAEAESSELVTYPARLSSLDLLRWVAAQYELHDFAIGKLVRIRPDADDVDFVSDRRLMERVLGNIVKNALEASAPGDTVTLTSRHTGRKILFSIHNPGVIPEHIQRRIFERAFSTKGVGRGLGMFGVRLLSERYLGGSVSFSSSKRAGTTFRAVYPLRLE